METEQSTTKAWLRYDELIPKYSLWRVGQSKQVYILLTVYGVWEGTTIRPRSVQLLDVLKEQSFHRSWREFIDDINAGRLVRIIQK